MSQARATMVPADRPARPSSRGRPGPSTRAARTIPAADPRRSVTRWAKTERTIACSKRASRARTRFAAPELTPDPAGRDRADRTELDRDPLGLGRADAADRDDDLAGLDRPDPAPVDGDVRDRRAGLRRRLGSRSRQWIRRDRRGGLGCRDRCVIGLAPKRSWMPSLLAIARRRASDGRPGRPTDGPRQSRGILPGVGRPVRPPPEVLHVGPNSAVAARRRGPPWS